MLKFNLLEEEEGEEEKTSPADRSIYLVYIGSALAIKLRSEALPMMHHPEGLSLSRIFYLLLSCSAEQCATLLQQAYRKALAITRKLV